MGKEQCVICGKELGFTTLKYKPKKEWNLEGHLCGGCYNQKDAKDRIEKVKEKDLRLLK